MKRGGKILKGTHNFSTFRSSSCQAKSPVRTLNKVNITKIKTKLFLLFNQGLSCNNKLDLW